MIERLRARGLDSLCWAGCAALLLLAALDPCAARSGAIEKQRAELEQQLERFARERRAHRDISPLERGVWAAQGAALRRWLPQGPDEPRILAQLARWFEGESVEALELERRESAGEPPALPWSEFELTPPPPGEPLRLQAIPVAVRLLADYADMARILETLETRAAPLLVERLSIERMRSQLRLSAELIFVVQAGPDAR